MKEKWLKEASHALAILARAMEMTSPFVSGSTLSARGCGSHPMICLDLDSGQIRLKVNS